MKFEKINTDKKVMIIAEIGNNHEGNFALAQEMIGRAAEMGADAVKFQTFIPELFVSNADQARLSRLKKFQLSFAQFESLAQLAQKSGVVFFSTPLDIESAKFLNGIQPVFKIASGDNNFYPLIETVAQFNKPMIVSTGLADIDLIGKLSRRINDIWEKNGVSPGLALLHCVASYPVPPEQANLAALFTLKSKFPNAVMGYSDHTMGIDASVSAVAMGARIIEKHFTLDKQYSDFRDHQLSADPSDLRQLVERTRKVELMMGSGEKIPQPCEKELLILARRSVAAAKNIEVGTVLTTAHISWLRPGTGIPPGDEGLLLGRKLARSLRQGEIILNEYLEVSKNG